jgi:hypothetical protein
MCTLAILARQLALGARFVLLGDFEGQFQPIGDAWPCEVKGTGLLRELARGLRVRLVQNRRSPETPGHFEYYSSLYPLADAPLLRATLEEAAARYPWRGEEGLFLVISHRDRRRVNAHFNARDGVLIRSRGAIRGASSQPQDMWLRPGMRLLGCGQRRILNGVEYLVRSVDDERVVVDMADEFKASREGLSDAELGRLARLEDRITLTHDEAWRDLRLRYAMCYATIQGRTIRNEHLVLLGGGNRHFSARTLIVGLSRVGDGAMAHLATAEQESELRCALPEVPDEEYAEEAEEEE